MFTVALIKNKLIMNLGIIRVETKVNIVNSYSISLLLTPYETGPVLHLSIFNAFKHIIWLVVIINLF